MVAGIRFMMAALLLVLVQACTPIVSGLNPLPRIHYNQILQSAEQGDVNAQAGLAEILYKACRPGCYYGKAGWEPECDEQACSKWYHLAAENGNAEAQKRLAGFYRYGSSCGIEKNEAMATKWYKKVSDQEVILPEELYFLKTQGEQ